MSVSYQSQQSSDDESLHPSNLRHSSTLEHSLYYEANEFQGTPLLPPSSSVDQSHSGNTENRSDYIKHRLMYYIPSIRWVSEYQYSNLLNDVIAGISVAFILIPQSLSYAQALVHLPPINGLFTSFASLFVYSFLGMSRQLAVGPDALIAILTGSAISEYIKHKQSDRGFTGSRIPFDSASESIYAATTISFLVGFLTFAMGFFRLGFLDSVLSRALLRGFISAVAFVVMIDLSDSLFGFSIQSLHVFAQGASPFQHLLKLVASLSSSHLPTLSLSIGSIVFLSILKSIKSTFALKYPKIKLIPEVLFLVVISTALSRHFQWSTFGIKILRDTASSLPKFQLPHLSITRINTFFLPAIMISLIGFVESIAVGKTYANKCHYSLSPNRELIALGSANIANSLLGGWPAFGSLGRSAVAYAADAKTQFAGFVTGVVILLTMIFFLPLFYHLPRAVCSSVIVVAAFGLIELHEVKLMIRLRAVSDFSLMMLTFLSTLFFSIQVGTLVSVGISLLMVVKRSTLVKISVLGQTYVQEHTLQPLKLKYRTTDESATQQIPHCLILRIEDSLFFGNSFSLKDRLKRLELHGRLNVHPGEPFTTTSLKCVIIDMSYVTSIDVSAIQTLSEVINAHTSRCVYVCLIKVRRPVLSMMHLSQLVETTQYLKYYGKISECVYDLKARGVLDEDGV